MAHFTDIAGQARSFMAERGIGGWLLYDYRYSNPVMWDALGPVAFLTRPCWLWVPVQGEPVLMPSTVDLSRFNDMPVEKRAWSRRDEMIDLVHGAVAGAGKVAMEYSPRAELPRAARVDAGTVELVREAGVEVVSSADLFQYATQRWGPGQLTSHKAAADLLSKIVLEAYAYIGDQLSGGIREHEVADFIRQRFTQEGLAILDGPVVAANANSADPHYEPLSTGSSEIKAGDWVLIDLWSHLEGECTMSADITWTGYVGSDVPAKHREVFNAVIGARDAAVQHLRAAHSQGFVLMGWEMDRVARDHITEAGYGEYFKHRLGHSIGREIHSNAVNLDNYETRDTRQIIPGICFSVEPGIYLPEFGVRSEIDVFLSDDGPVVTTVMQTEPVLVPV
jgi:Xaa-Pro dipeptidase